LTIASQPSPASATAIRSQMSPSTSRSRAFEVGRIARVGQLVEDDDVLAGCDEALREVRADEAGAAGDEHAHRRKPT
jgi:hypothetical protein